MQATESLANPQYNAHPALLVSQENLASDRNEITAGRVIRDSADYYCNEISKSQYAPLPHSVLLETARRMRSGDAQARQQMIESNLRLAYKIASGYTISSHYRGFDFADLVQYANLGLIKAVERFNPDAGFHFSTYAKHWIHQCIKLGLKNDAKTIRTPVHYQELCSKILAATVRLEMFYGRCPTSGELGGSPQCVG